MQRADFTAAEDLNEEVLATAITHIFKELPKLPLLCQRAALYSIELLTSSLQTVEALATFSGRDQFAESLHAQMNKNGDDVLILMRIPHNDKAPLNTSIGCYPTHSRKTLSSSQCLLDKMLMSLLRMRSTTIFRARTTQPMSICALILVFGSSADPAWRFQGLDAAPFSVYSVCRGTRSREQIHGECPTQRRAIASAHLCNRIQNGHLSPGLKQFPTVRLYLTKIRCPWHDRLYNRLGINESRYGLPLQDSVDHWETTACHNEGAHAPGARLVPSPRVGALESCRKFVKEHDIVTCGFTFDSISKDNLTEGTIHDLLRLRHRCIRHVDDAAAHRDVIRVTAKHHEARADRFRSGKHR